MMACVWNLNEAQGICSKTPPKLLTAVMRLTRHLNSGFTHAQSCARWKIGCGNIQFNNEIVAEGGQRLTLCDQLGHVLADNGELRIPMARRASIPLITGHALLWRQANAFQRLVDAGRAAANYQHEPSGIGRRRRQGGKRLLKLRKGAMQGSHTHCVPAV